MLIRDGAHPVLYADDLAEELGLILGPPAVIRAKRGLITDTELAAVPIAPHDWHGEWNYTLDAQTDPA